LTSYYFPVTRVLQRSPDFVPVLEKCGVTVTEVIDVHDPEKYPWLVSYPDPLDHLTDILYVRVEDPEAPAELEGRQVELTFTRTETTPDTGDKPTLDVVTYNWEITGRRPI
jgi:hypothetical protein